MVLTTRSSLGLVHLTVFPWQARKSPSSTCKHRTGIQEAFLLHIYRTRVQWKALCLGLKILTYFILCNINQGILYLL